MSEVDKKWLIERAKISHERILTISNGVDSNYFKPDTSVINGKNSIIFRGIMSFQPNIDACLYFIKEIFPMFKREIPDIKFYIVGSNSPHKIKKLSSSDIVITGYVEDIRKYMGRCMVNIAPMISGSGIKNKILEAMAMEIPTVATSLATDGIEGLSDEKNVLIAKNSEEFAKKYCFC